MAVAVEKLIGTRQSRAVYIASRWIPALKIIEPATKYHSGAARPPSNVKNFHHFDGGDALAAKEGTDPKGFILAVLDKANNEEAAGKILNIGLNEAIRRETDAQLQYAAEKMWAEPMSLLFG
jgi:hypothetical protein